MGGGRVAAVIPTEGPVKEGRVKLRRPGQTRPLACSGDLWF